MEPTVVGLIQEQIHQGFQHTNQKIDILSECVRTHMGKDEAYWKKIDDQQAQMRLVKAVGASGIFVSAVAWLWQKFGH